MKMEQTECSETLAYKIQTPGNYPEENIQHTEHGESLKSKIICNCLQYGREFCHRVIIYPFSGQKDFHRVCVLFNSG
jgi:hypothetical protein